MGTRVALAAVAASVALFAAPAALAADSTIDRVAVESFDGTDLRGWLIRPAGVAEPLATILISSPYLGQCVKSSSLGRGPCWPTPDDPANWYMHPEPVEWLVDQGYAVAWFSVRGTGLSGGCIDDMGPREQRDQGVLVDWIADQPWSSGEVGAMGLSYMSATALSAAVERPAALKTVVVGGVVDDLYTYAHSPQGLSSSINLIGNEALYLTDLSLLPAGIGSTEPAVTAEAAPRHGERLCPEAARAMTEGAKGAATGLRDADFWLDRRLYDDYDGMKASVLVAHGLQDLWNSGHKMQEDPMWERIPTRKAMYLGQWAHAWPWQEWAPPGYTRPDLKDEWFALLGAWLDHELRDGPMPDLTGSVRFEDDRGGWHESGAWPPAESRDEALFATAGGELAASSDADESSARFRSYFQPARMAAPEAFLCPSPLDGAAGRGSVVYLSEPVAERTVVAGNPMAYLDLEADQPGGAVQVTLFDLEPGFECTDPLGTGASGARRLTVGGADLRFHHGGFDARPFDEGHVRVDLANLATVLEPGHRLAMTLSYGDPYQYAEASHSPNVTVRSGPRADASQLVVPVLEGTLGGDAPTAAFPPRP